MLIIDIQKLKAKYEELFLIQWWQKKTLPFSKILMKKEIFGFFLTDCTDYWISEQM